MGSNPTSRLTVSPMSPLSPSRWPPDLTAINIGTGFVPSDRSSSAFYQNLAPLAELNCLLTFLFDSADKQIRGFREDAGDTDSSRHALPYSSAQHDSGLGFALLPSAHGNLPRC